MQHNLNKSLFFLNKTGPTALVDRLATLAVLEELTLPFEGARLIGNIVPDGLTLYLKRTTSLPKGSQLRKKHNKFD